LSYIPYLVQQGEAILGYVISVNHQHIHRVVNSITIHLQILLGNNASRGMEKLNRVYVSLQHLWKKIDNGLFHLIQSSPFFLSLRLLFSWSTLLYLFFFRHSYCVSQFYGAPFSFTFPEFVVWIILLLVKVVWFWFLIQWTYICACWVFNLTIKVFAIVAGDLDCFACFVFACVDSKGVDHGK